MLGWQETSIEFIEMSRLVLLVFLVAAGVAVMAAPPKELEDGTLEEYEALVLAKEEDEHSMVSKEHIRKRRFTCDLLSFGGKVNHSACAANCYTLGKAGGRCNDGVCQCFKTTLRQQWDRRFGG